MYPTKNLTARVYSVYADIVRRAAHSKNKTVSEYVGEIVVPYAAEDIGEEVPPLPKLEKDRHKKMVAQAAAARGMTPAQYERHAADVLSAMDLGLPTPEDALAPPAPRPRVQARSERPRASANIGGYAKAEERPAILRRRSK